MNLSAPFIARPVATTLLTIGVALAGALAFVLLPVSPLPQVDLPTIQVTANLPGASPETVATSVATPLERHLGTIADVSEMTSSSTVGAARITLQFGLDRDIDGAARDVQAAINAARADLPSSLRSNPTYRKVNPADAPVLILALTSQTLSQGQIYDSAATVIEQMLSQVEGVGDVQIGGSSLPAVRVELNPTALNKYGVGLEDVRAALAAANANAPKGAIEDGPLHYQLYTNDQASKAAAYRSLLVGYRKGAPIRLTDVGEVSDSVEDLRNAGLANGKDSVIVLLFRQPGANIIDTVDRVVALIPTLKASVPAAIDLTVAADRTTTIRASLRETEHTLLTSVGLVILVVFLFLRSPRAALIPSVAVPVSLIGTFGVMYLLGFSLDIFSLMALTVATGFVVDDAIVVLENINRHIESGMKRLDAGILGAREVGFTVLSMSVSLIAVFLPILLMGGIVGRLFREFALTLSVSIVVSLIVSLTTTPMMCAYLSDDRPRGEPGRLSRLSARAFDGLLGRYLSSLDWALARPFLMILVLGATILFNFYLYIEIPKGFFPQQDTGRLIGNIQADQSISFQSMKGKLAEFIAILQADPDVDTAVGFTGGRQSNGGFVFVTLKPIGVRTITADRVIERLRGKLGRIAGAVLFLQSAQDLRAGGRPSNALYQYTLQGEDLKELFAWTPKITRALQAVPEMTDVNSDQQEKGLETDLTIDRKTAARLGITPSEIDNTLYDAFGQRQVSTIFNPLNQYHVIMEVAPRFWQSPETLRDIWISTSGGSVSGSQATGAVAGTTTGKTGSGATAATLAADVARNAQTNAITVIGHGSASTGAAISPASETMVPLSAVASWGPGSTPLGVNHQGPFVASTISFNLPPGGSLGAATQAINRTMAELKVPGTIHGSFAGTANVYQSSMSNQPLLILAALITIYIVLGILYESYIHPITILSTLPSAGVGALIGLRICNTQFDIIAFIGVILLIGIVKKNAIMMIDFALDAQRQGQMEPRAAIREACHLRFRPIMMTTMAAILGAVPLALGVGDGAELRQPLGISIVGGLLFSQVLTLYTTPVVYLYLDRFQTWGRGLWRRPRPDRSLIPEPAE
jgi:multidrug efflux pump